ncbi:PspC domain-containing protein [Aestuariispira insulae]|uniref:Phage shock protein PspC (Stress-responsive transcriptional regulator) n=1 Tax=Aestuariispira insulae TaxID=1461337 RepID=A0A3D9HWL5_9PROT|nr:PspC domain-containing protein [Aestuariispira insulae]RED53800.1 phage shock protein PspC (stress-responsive transcriptional regulator) [Aestuariispira insulae]
MKCHSNKRKTGHKRPKGGVIRRVTGGLGHHFGLHRHWVEAGFIVCLVVNPPLAIFLFLVAWFWVDHPGKVEGWWSQMRNFGRAPHVAAASATGAGTAYSGYRETEEPRFSEKMEESDPFFQDLKDRFDDLEKRAGSMEEHVASEEYELRREFRKMEDGN